MLRAHVQRRAAEAALLGQSAIAVHYGLLLHQAEVQELGHVVDAASLGGKDVGRLDVAVDQPFGVGLAQGFADLPQEMNGPFRRQRPVIPDEFLQAQPRQQFHHVVERAVVGVAVVVDLDGVPVGQLGRGLHFALKPCQDGDVGCLARA